MLKETYTPRVGYAVIDTVILRPKEEKAIFINKEANNSIIKDEDILTYRAVSYTHLTLPTILRV